MSHSSEEQNAADIERALDRAIKSRGISQREDVVLLGLNANHSTYEIDDLLKSGKKVIAYCIESVPGIAHKEPNIRRLIGDERNFRYFNIMTGVSSLDEAMDSLERPFFSNPALTLVVEQEGLKENINAIKHDLNLGAQDERGRIALQKARNLACLNNDGWQGTDEEVTLNFREQFGRLMSEEFKTPKIDCDGRYFPGLFIDIEGTLIKEGDLDYEVLRQADQKSLKMPVTVWTGGDIASLVLQLPRDFPYVVVSKWDYSGARVQEVWDDMDREEFKAQYDISSERYVIKKDTRLSELLAAHREQVNSAAKKEKSLLEDYKNTVESLKVQQRDLEKKSKEAKETIQTVSDDLKDSSQRFQEYQTFVRQRDAQIMLGLQRAVHVSSEISLFNYKSQIQQIQETLYAIQRQMQSQIGNQRRDYDR